MPTIDRDGVRIYYEVHGSGPPLLLTHGYSSTSGMWQGQIAALSKHHKLVLWDMRGHGQSGYPEDGSAYSEALTVADMAALLDAAGAGQAIVGGLSLGGYMSLAFYRAHPERVRALLIIDTGPGFKKDEAREAWNKRAHDTGDRFEREGLEVLKSASRERSSVTHRDASGLARAARTRPSADLCLLVERSGLSAARTSSPPFSNLAPISCAVRFQSARASSLRNPGPVSMISSALTRSGCTRLKASDM